VQANQVAHFFQEKPDIIFHTLFERTRQTTEPAIARFPDVPVEMLPMHEFTYLNTEAYAGTTVSERRERAVSYWNQNNPYQNDGGESESFMDLIERIYQSFDILTKRKEKVIFVFSHEQILKMTKLLLSVESEDKTPEELMRHYSEVEFGRPIKNCEVHKVTIDDDGNWSQMESVFIPEE
jgi:broad specificity phosphatase PhoE